MGSNQRHTCNFFFCSSGLNFDFLLLLFYCSLNYMIFILLWCYYCVRCQPGDKYNTQTEKRTRVPIG